MNKKKNKKYYIDKDGKMRDIVTNEIVATLEESNNSLNDQYILLQED